MSRRRIQDEVAHPFSRVLWLDFIKSHSRRSQTLAAGGADVGGEGQMKVNACKCQKPCGAVKCKPEMVYEWPEVFPRLPE